MKMTLNLTYEDGMKVFEAMKDVAIKNGWNTGELDGIIEEYSSALDAALTVMGIEVRIASEPKVENENKYCDSAADTCFCIPMMKIRIRTQKSMILVCLWITGQNLTRIMAKMKIQKMKILVRII